VVDLFSRKIVGWSMKDTLHTDLCVEALEMALAARRPGKGLLHHSDQGSHYCSEPYQTQLNNFKITCSMSRVGNCWDNAPVESLSLQPQMRAGLSKEIQDQTGGAAGHLRMDRDLVQSQTKAQFIGLSQPRSF
jgi:transposase InsO family protein